MEGKSGIKGPGPDQPKPLTVETKVYPGSSQIGKGASKTGGGCAEGPASKK